MTHTPSPTGLPAALALRLSEAALESSGWPAVARAVEAEAGPGLAIRFHADGDRSGARPAEQEAGIDLSVAGLGTWILEGPEASSEALEPSVPLRESLALAERLEKGLPQEPSELEAVLDLLPYAVLLLDGEACLLFANATGEDLLASRRLFRPARRGTPIRPTRRRIDEALEAALARILHENDPGTRWVARGPAGTHLVIHVRPVGPARTERGAARILLTLRAIGAARGASG